MASTPTDDEPRAVTAGFLIIGNEILSGRTRDANLSVLAEKLGGIGVRVVECRVVPDIEAKIIDSIHDMRGSVDYLFTSGGIGPTHDDITADCVAKAFDVGIEKHTEAMRRLAAHYGGQEEFTPARQRMARIPVGAKLVDNPVSTAPGFWIENVIVCAGVPRIFAGMIDSVLPHLEGGAKTHALTFSALIGESSIAEEMAQVQASFPDIDIGSYPYFRNGLFGTSIVIRGTDNNRLETAQNNLKGLIASRNIEMVDADHKDEVAVAPAGA